MINMPEIDQQHQGIVDMLNLLNDAVKKREARKDIYRIIDEIISQTCSHFETEERLMVEAGYPEIEWHKKQHRRLIQDARRLKDKLEYVGEEMFTEWFNHWPFANVLAHIQFADKQIKDYIVQSGVQSGLKA